MTDTRTRNVDRASQSGALQSIDRIFITSKITNRMTDSKGELKPTLGLVGITINAMALIAPGAFLWTTYQLQAPPDSAKNMWAAIALATCIALLTASCYATLSKAYPEAGAGSSYYYAEAAILAKEEHKHFRLARLAKFVTGWAAHLYYWVYPGIMISFMGTLVIYMGQLFDPGFATDWFSKALICFIFTGLVGFIALQGVTGSTLINIIINIVQISSLTFLGLLMIVYRLVIRM
ncbi:MAG: APC family permease [Microcoleus sp. SM1_3_4]|nr:APC family permease [Microcoleus sp. SM1_3_4]